MQTPQGGPKHPKPAPRPTWLQRLWGEMASGGSGRMISTLVAAELWGGGAGGVLQQEGAFGVHSGLGCIEVLGVGVSGWFNVQGLGLAHAPRCAASSSRVSSRRATAAPRKSGRARHAPLLELAARLDHVVGAAAAGALHEALHQDERLHVLAQPGGVRGGSVGFPLLVAGSAGLLWGQGCF